jgi:hypothetical protein
MTCRRGLKCGSLQAKWPICTPCPVRHFTNSTTPLQGSQRPIGAITTHRQCPPNFSLRHSHHPDLRDASGSVAGRTAQAASSEEGHEISFYSTVPTAVMCDARVRGIWGPRRTSLGCLSAFHMRRWWLGAPSLITRFVMSSQGVWEKSRPELVGGIKSGGMMPVGIWKCCYLWICDMIRYQKGRHI